MIVNFDLLIAMLLNNCCKIILLSCNSTIDMYILEKGMLEISKNGIEKVSIFLRKSESSTELTDWVFGDSDTRFIMRCLYRCTQMRPCFLYFAMQTKNAVDI